MKLSYCASTGQKPKKLNQMLTHFSEKHPDIKNRESKNAFDINLRIAVHLVEKMRHSIVHNQGFVNNKESFINKVISQSGVGNNKSSHEEFVSQFILEDKICILETPANHDSHLPLYHDQYRMLVSYLISYAYLVNDAAL